MFAAITECGLLLGDHHQLPSKHRVGSYTSANAEQCAGTMVCDVLSQCILESFGADGGAEAANNTDRDSDDWRKMMKKKVWRAVHSMEVDVKLHRMIVNWLALPLDHCWMRIQHLDFQGGILRSLANPSMNPFNEVQQAYGQMIFERIASGSLKTLFWHVEPNVSDGAHGPIHDQVRATAVSMDLQVRLFFKKFGEPPFTLVALADPTKSFAEKVIICADFLAAFLCDLEPGMAEKIYNFYETAEQMASDEDLIELMGNWVEVSRITSMDVERLLALIKKSVSKKRAAAERICSSGMLTQWHASHISAGGADPKIVKLSDLIQAGAPLKAAKEKKPIPTKGRGHIEYCNEKYQERVQQNGGSFEKVAGLDLRKLLCAEYWGLPHLERQKWDSLAQSGDAENLCMPHAPERVDDYDRNQGGVLWNLSTKANIVNPELAKALLENYPGITHVGGLNSFSDVMRTRFLESLIVEDDGKVCPGAHVRRKTCWEKYPGVCEHEDEDFLPQVIKSAKILHKWAEQHVPCFCELRSTGTDGFEIVTWFFFAYQRKKDPRVGLATPCVPLDTNALAKEREVDDASNVKDNIFSSGANDDVSLDIDFKNLAAENEDLAGCMPESFDVMEGSLDFDFKQLAAENEDLARCVPESFDVMEDEGENEGLRDVEKAGEDKDVPGDVFLAIVKETSTGTFSLQTSFGMLKEHFAAHWPEAPATLGIVKLSYVNLDDRLDVVKLVEGAAEETCLLTAGKAETRSERFERDRQNKYEVAFRSIGKTEDIDDDDDMKSESGSTSTGSDEPFDDDDDRPKRRRRRDPPAPSPAPVPEPPAPPEPPVVPPVVPPVEPPAPPEPPEPEEPHVRIWLTRTGRKATCASCRGDLEKHSFRMLHHPDPRRNPDPRVWKRNWWTYHHLTPVCIGGTDVTLEELSDLIVDCSRLPKSFRESDEASGVGM